MRRSTSRSRGVSCSSSGSVAGGAVARERVEHEAGEPRREHRVAGRDRADRLDQLVGRDRLGDVAAHAGADRRDHVFGRVAHRQREEADVGMRGEHLGDHPRAAAARHVHVDEHDVGHALADHLDRGVDLGRRADHVDLGAELGAHTGEEQLMIVDEEDA